MSIPFRVIFEGLEGVHHLGDLMEQLKAVARQYQDELPPGFGATSILGVALDRGWVFRHGPARERRFRIFTRGSMCRDMSERMCIVIPVCEDSHPW